MNTFLQCERKDKMRNCFEFGWFQCTLSDCVLQVDATEVQKYRKHMIMYGWRTATLTPCCQRLSNYNPQIACLLYSAKSCVAYHPWRQWADERNTQRIVHCATTNPRILIEPSQTDGKSRAIDIPSPFNFLQCEKKIATPNFAVWTLVHCKTTLECTVNPHPESVASQWNAKLQMMKSFFREKLGHNVEMSQHQTRIENIRLLKCGS
jgi:hypothetical protein